MDKAILRKTHLDSRNNLEKETVVRNSLIIQNILLSTKVYKQAKIIHCYRNINNEVQTNKIIIKSLRNGKTILVPDITNTQKHYILTKVDDYFSLISKGCTFPDSDISYLLADIDVVITPLVSFDENNNRIGMGSGWYDKFFHGLKGSPTKIALAFKSQQSSKVSAEKHDIPLDYIFTENTKLTNL